MTYKNFLTRRRGGAEPVKAAAAHDFFLFHTKARRHEEGLDYDSSAPPRLRVKKLYTHFVRNFQTNTHVIRAARKTSHTPFVSSCLRANQKIHTVQI